MLCVICGTCHAPVYIPTNHPQARRRFHGFHPKGANGALPPQVVGASSHRRQIRPERSRQSPRQGLAAQHAFDFTASKALQYRAPGDNEGLALLQDHGNAALGEGMAIDLQLAEKAMAAQ